jgi:hypothetical protein
MFSVLLAALGALCVVCGVALLSIPAAVITAGVVLVVAAYVVRYLEVKRYEDA